MGLWDGENAAAESPSESSEYFSIPEKLSGTSGMSLTVYFVTCDGLCPLQMGIGGFEGPGVHITESETKVRAELAINLLCCTLILLVLPRA